MSKLEFSQQQRFASLITNYDNKRHQSSYSPESSITNSALNTDTTHSREFNINFPNGFKNKNIKNMLETNDINYNNNFSNSKSFSNNVSRNSNKEINLFDNNSSVEKAFTLNSLNDYSDQSLHLSSFTKSKNIKRKIATKSNKSNGFISLNEIKDSSKLFDGKNIIKLKNNNSNCQKYNQDNLRNAKSTKPNVLNGDPYEPKDNKALQQNISKKDDSANIHSWRDFQPILRQKLNKFNQSAHHSPPTRDLTTEVSNQIHNSLIVEYNDANKFESENKNDNDEMLDQDIPPAIPPRKTYLKRHIKKKLKTPEKEILNKSKKSREYNRDEVQQFMKNQKAEQQRKEHESKELEKRNKEKKISKLKQLDAVRFRTNSYAKSSFQSLEPGIIHLYKSSIGNESVSTLIDLPKKSEEIKILSNPLDNFNDDENKPGLYNKWISNNCEMNFDFKEFDHSSNNYTLDLKHKRPSSNDKELFTNKNDSLRNRLITLKNTAISLKTRVQLEESLFLKDNKSNSIIKQSFSNALSSSTNQDLNFRCDNVHNIFKAYETNRPQIEYFTCDTDNLFIDINSKRQITDEKPHKSFANNMTSHYNSLPSPRNRPYFLNLTNRDNLKRLTSGLNEEKDNAQVLRLQTDSNLGNLKKATSSSNEFMDQNMNTKVDNKRHLMRISSRGADDIYPSNSESSFYSLSKQSSVSSLATIGDIEILQNDSQEYTLIENDGAIGKNKEDISIKIKKLKLDERFLTKKEKELRQRKKKALYLLNWHNRLTEKETEVLQLESMVALLPLNYVKSDEIVQEKITNNRSCSVITQPLHPTAPTLPTHTQLSIPLVSFQQDNYLNSAATIESTEFHKLPKNQLLPLSHKHKTVEIEPILSEDDVSRQIQELLKRYIITSSNDVEAVKESWVANQVQILLAKLTTGSPDVSQKNTLLQSQEPVPNNNIFKSETKFSTECRKIFEESDALMRERGLLTNQIISSNADSIILDNQNQQSNNPTNALIIKEISINELSIAEKDNSIVIKNNMRDETVVSLENHSENSINKQYNSNNEKSINLLIHNNLDKIDKFEDNCLSVTNESNDTNVINKSDKLLSSDKEEILTEEIISNIIITNKNVDLSEQSNKSISIDDTSLGQINNDIDKCSFMDLHENSQIKEDSLPSKIYEDDFEISIKSITSKSDEMLSKSIDEEINVKNCILDSNNKLDENINKISGNIPSISDNHSKINSDKILSDKVIAKSESSFLIFNDKILINDFKENINEKIAIDFNKEKFKLNDVHCEDESNTLTDISIGEDSLIDDNSFKQKHQILNKIVENIITTDIFIDSTDSNKKLVKSNNFEPSNKSEKIIQNKLSLNDEIDISKEKNRNILDNFDDESLNSARCDNKLKPKLNFILPNLSIEDDFVIPAKLNLDDLQSPESANSLHNIDENVDKVELTTAKINYKISLVEENHIKIDEKSILGKDVLKKEETLDEDEDKYSALWDSITPTTKSSLPPINGATLVDKSISVLELKPVIPWTIEELQPIIDDILTYFWSKQHLRELWIDLELSKDIINKRRNFLLNKEEQKSCTSYISLLFEYIKIFLLDLYNENTSNMNRHFKEPPKNLIELSKIVSKEIQYIFARENKLKNYLKKNVKNVDSIVEDLLVKELRQEEQIWIDYRSDEVVVKHQMADFIFVILLDDTVSAITKACNRKNLNH